MGVPGGEDALYSSQTFALHIDGKKEKWTMDVDYAYGVPVEILQRMNTKGIQYLDRHE